MEENCLYRKLCFHLKALGFKDSSIMKKRENKQKAWKLQHAICTTGIS